jgi:hypothetical protein
MATQGWTSFFGAFLDGFTGAGLARKLSIPGEPIPGFAPSSTDPQTVTADFAGRRLSLILTDPEQESRTLQPVREIRYENASRKFIMVVESASGEVSQILLEADSVTPAEPISTNVRAS